ncbi:hypothetical protein [Bradyrhizobium sp. 76]|uniref:hypothetical protein n=1 Tax=Bradyrhizobium sp. 76 TaxID=2782680 RepID=UPI001FFBC07C|nr:hypothetical protein [Bradyrhizobium sp. 76]MCK1404431.1 hypothetical protein [Bradyrhizobium sp. 76]
MPDGRPVKIALGEMRAAGVRGLIAFCLHNASHNVILGRDVVDQWADEVRFSDLEPRFVCKACGKRGADVRPGSEPTIVAVVLPA